jgi:Bacterial regulatory proteins, luxR family
VEVDKLASRELTNRQIASNLMLSEYTVATHIRNILKKLGLHSRPQIQVRRDIAIRRHWQLVCCAFSLCWWTYGRLPTEELAQKTENDPISAEPAGREKKEARDILTRDFEGGKGVVGALRNGQSILEGVLSEAPATEAESAA